VAVRRQLFPLFWVLAGASLVGLLIYGVSARSASRTLDDQVAHHLHPQAPQATRELPRLGARGDGSVAALRGKVIILNFWASWCPPCQTAAPLLERAQRRLERHAGTVLGVTYLDASPDSQSFVRRHHITYPSLRDPSGAFAHAYGTDQLPESFLLDRRGQIAAIARGAINQRFLDRALALAESS